MRVVIAILIASVTLSAQTITTGPVSSLNKVVWGTADGLTVSEAQALEARLKVDGTVIVLTGMVCTPNTLTDGSGGVWSYGAGQAPSIQILRNGVQAASAFGAKMAVIGGVLYLQGDDLLYYKWNGSAFPRTVAADPTAATIDAAAVTRWGCQAPIGLPLMRLLNIRGPHTLTLRLYETVGKIESIDSLSFLLTMPQIVTQPITVRIIQ